MCKGLIAGGAHLIALGPAAALSTGFRAHGKLEDDRMCVWFLLLKSVAGQVSELTWQPS